MLNGKKEKLRRASNKWESFYCLSFPTRFLCHLWTVLFLKVYLVLWFTTSTFKATRLNLNRIHSNRCCPTDFTNAQPPQSTEGPSAATRGVPRPASCGGQEMLSRCSKPAPFPSSPTTAHTHSSLLGYIWAGAPHRGSWRVTSPGSTSIIPIPAILHAV